MCGTCVGLVWDCVGLCGDGCYCVGHMWDCMGLCGPMWVCGNVGEPLLDGVGMGVTVWDMCGSV